MSDTPEKAEVPKPFVPPVGKKIALAEDTGSLALGDALKSVFGVLKFVMLAVLVIFVGSGVFTVEPNEVAVVLRFGKPVGTTREQVKKAGLHFAFPYPIDEIVKIPFGKSHSIETSSGWYFETPEDIARGAPPRARATLAPYFDGYVISADGNVFHALGTMRYRVTDPVKYVFYYTDATSILQNIINRAMIHAATEFNADAAIYRSRSEFSARIRELIREGLIEQPMGISMEDFEVKTAPPLYVKSAFEQVQAAEQERSRKINVAQGKSSEITKLAEGEAESRRQGGIIESNRLVSAIQAEALSFTAQLQYYENDSDLFKRRVLSESLIVVMDRANDKFFLPVRRDGSSRVVHLKLNRETVRPPNREVVANDSKR
jgi:membrane protease subunit HflK